MKKTNRRKGFLNRTNIDPLAVLSAFAHNGDESIAVSLNFGS